jgi:anaerobic magnesium-protoporphyrin IX monomethyl ester cyclase
MTDLLLIPAPYVHECRPVPYVPCGLLSLQAVARRCGSSLDILQLAPLAGRAFASSDDLATAVADLVDGGRYAAVGLSTMCSSFHHSVGVALRLNERYPGLRIWLGGPHVSADPQVALERYPGIDAVFVGETEETIRDLATQTKSIGRARLAGVPGILTRQAPFIARRPLSDLDALPFVDEAPDLLPSLRASEHTPSEVPVEAMRGCTGRCSFCSTSRYWGRRVRRKSAGRLLEEIDRVTAVSSLKSISLVGDDLAASRDALLEFCQRMSEESPPDVKWGGSLAVSRLQPEDLEILWKGRCRSIFIGLESASEATLRRIGKNIDLNKSLVLIDRALRMGFAVHASFIIGFPWETAPDINQTYALHVSLLERGVRSQLSTLCPLPGTPLARTEVIHPGEGISRAAFDNLPHGPIAEGIIQTCPELFTQLGRFDMGVGAGEVNALARVASMVGNHYRGHKRDGAATEARPALPRI